MVKIVGNNKEVDEMVNFIENTISNIIEDLSHHGCQASRDQYIKYDTEITDIDH